MGAQGGARALARERIGQLDYRVREGLHRPRRHSQAHPLRLDHLSEAVSLGAENRQA
jgi:hypothetical protein